MDRMPLSDYEYETRILTALERIAAGVERTNQLLASKGAQPGTKFAEEFNRLAWDVFKNPVVIRQAGQS